MKHTVTSTIAPYSALRAFWALLFAAVVSWSLVGCAQPEGETPDVSPEQNVPSENATAEDTPTVDYATAVVSYLGPEGTYTQEACQVFFEDQGTYEPYETVSGAVQALLAGESDYAVIPQENTIGGPVTDYLDVLLAHEDVFVVGEVELPINQNLLVQSGTAIEDIQVIYSHQQGLIQGAAWLEANIPHAETVVVASTAEGARMVSESSEATCAAIASKGASEVYGLEMLAEAIQMSDANKTRFYVLSVVEPTAQASDRLAFVASGSAEDLPELLALVDEQGMTVVAVHDRPEKTELGRYDYLVECENATLEDYTNLTACKAFAFRYLGCFPLA